MESAVVEMNVDEVQPQEPKPAEVLQHSAALNLLSQYSDSENENENEEEVKEPENPTNQYRTAELDSSSSSSSDSDEEIDVKEIKKKLEPEVSDDDSENEDPAKEKKKKQPLKVRGELLLEDLPPIQDLEISVDEKECLEIGTITSIVDQLVLVEAYPHSAALDIDSVLFLENGKKALGQIFDVIGQVSTPIYCIRFNKHDDIVAKDITVGSKVFCAPRTEYANFVIISKIMVKGSDASWKNDVEIPENMLEYSDDEEERSARRKKKNPDQQTTAPRRRNHSQNYSWHNQINNQPPRNWNNQQPQHQFQNYNFYPQNPYSQ